MTDIDNGDSLAYSTNLGRRFRTLSHATGIWIDQRARRALSTFLLGGSGMKPTSNAVVLAAPSDRLFVDDLLMHHSTDNLSGTRCASIVSYYAPADVVDHPEQPPVHHPRLAVHHSMTALTQRKSDLGVIFGFPVLIAALVVWRAWSSAPVAAAIAAIIGIAACVAIVLVMRQPQHELRIGPERIEWGPIGTSRESIDRNAPGALRFSRAPRIGSPWLLHLRDAPTSTAIDLTGFSPSEVRAVCEQHGWHFDQDLFTDPH